MKQQRLSHSIQQKQPTVFIAVSYSVIYDDFREVNPLDLIKGIPTVAIVIFVAEKYSKVIYAGTDKRQQKRDVFDMRPYLQPKARKRLNDFVKDCDKHGNPVFLFGHEGCMMLYRLALQNHTLLEPNDDTDLCLDEYEPVYKALLYCNQIWTDGQLSKDDKDFVKMSIKMDIPVVEYKLFKDFRPQLYKANQFFTFCEKDTTYKTYLKYYCSDMLATSWADFGIYEASIKSPIITYREHGNIDFVRQFLINENDI